VFSTLLGMMITMLSSLQERRREMAILRAVGARPLHIFFLLTNEALLVALLGGVLGWLGLYLGMYGLSPYFVDWFGINLSIGAPSIKEGIMVLSIVLAAVLMSLIPGWRAYKNSLIDGLTIRT